MGKLSGYMAGLAVTLFLAAAGIAASLPNERSCDPSYLTAIWMGASIAAGLCVLFGVLHAIRLFRKYQRPLHIRDDWRCDYWPTQGQLKVTAWFDDYSLANSFQTQCMARFGQDAVNVPVKMIGGTYMTRTGMPGPGSPVMLEFLAENVKLGDHDEATISIKMKPSQGIWAWVERTKKVAVSRVGSNQ